VVAESTITPAERQRLRKMKERIDPDGAYVGESRAILRVFEKIEFLNLLPESPVLIVGPTGAGKTEIAELIHRHSKRKGKFAREQAAHSRMGDFGAVKGRWVGYGEHTPFRNIPSKGHTGILQECAGGTVFLDEVAGVTEDMQEFLLDVLDRKLIPLTTGKGPAVRPDVRLIFATNVDLDKAVEEGRFRHDLLRRIKQRTIRIPPLADRKEDIPVFISAKCAGYAPTPGFLLALLRYDWPGNVGELLDVLSAATAKAGGRQGPLTLDHLDLNNPSIIQDIRAMDDQGVERAALSDLADLLRRQGWEKRRGLQGEMARLLNVSAATISRKLSEPGLSL
jgi:DNA-binding NtrC family response regulator